MNDNKQRTGLGTASLVLGLLALLLFPTGINLILAILAIIFGIVQLCKKGGHFKAICGIVCSVIAILMSAFLFVDCFFSYNNSEAYADGASFGEYLELVIEQMN